MIILIASIVGKKKKIGGSIEPPILLCQKAFELKNKDIARFSVYTAHTRRCAMYKSVLLVSRESNFRKANGVSCFVACAIPKITRAFVAIKTRRGAMYKALHGGRDPDALRRTSCSTSGIALRSG